MTIKEIAARTGVSADTLRYYERMGIIPAVPRCRLYKPCQAGRTDLPAAQKNTGAGA